MNVKESVKFKNVALITGIANGLSAAYQLAEGSRGVAAFNLLAGIAVLGV